MVNTPRAFTDRLDTIKVDFRDSSPPLKFPPGCLKLTTETRTKRRTGLQTRGHLPKNGYLYLQGADLLRRYPASLRVFQAQLDHGAVHHLSEGCAREQEKRGRYTADGDNRNKDANGDHRRQSQGKNGGRAQQDSSTSGRVCTFRRVRSNPSAETNGNLSSAVPLNFVPTDVFKQSQKQKRANRVLYLLEQSLTGVPPSG